MIIGEEIAGFRGSPAFAARAMRRAGCIAKAALDMENVLFVSWFWFGAFFPFGGFWSLSFLLLVVFVRLCLASFLRWGLLICAPFFS